MTKQVTFTIPVDMEGELEALASIRRTSVDVEVQKALNKTLEPIRHVVVAQAVGGRACLYCQRQPPMESGICADRVVRNPYL